MQQSKKARLISYSKFVDKDYQLKKRQAKKVAEKKAKKENEPSSKNDKRRSKEKEIASIVKSSIVKTSSNAEISKLDFHLIYLSLPTSTKITDIIFSKFARPIKYNHQVLDNAVRDDDNLVVLVRNPWEYLVSYFFSNLDQISQVNFSEWCQESFDCPHELEDQNLKDFIKYGQAHWLKNHHAVTVINYSNFEDDYEDLKNRYQLPYAVVLPKEDKYYHKHYSYYYDQELMEKIANHFNHDIKLFNFDFDDKKVCSEKKFLYLTQSETGIPKGYISLNSVNSDILCLSWKKPDDNTFFYPNSTWTEGRNKLIYLARELDQSYLYYIPMDDDTVFDEGSFELFERLLLKYLPAVASPRHYKHNVKCEKLEMEAHTIYSFDAILNAFHQDVFFDDTLLPYIECFDKESWWYSQLCLIHYNHQFYPKHTLQFNQCYVNNGQHRPYPRGHDFVKIEEILMSNFFNREAIHLLSHPKDSTNIQVEDPSPPLDSYKIDLATKKKYLKNYQSRCVICTTINPPTKAIKKLLLYPYDLIIVGDLKTPPEAYLNLEQVIYLSPERQKEEFPELSDQIRWNHYSRKNLGYAYAIKHGYEAVGEIDDDTIPYGNWFNFKELHRAMMKKKLFSISGSKFVNPLSLFTEAKLWPRGYPLTEVKTENEFNLRQDLEEMPKTMLLQGLVDGDPDVDAICRLVNPAYHSDFQFDNSEEYYVFDQGTVAPGNTQNVWWLDKQAYYYMYLPTTVNFRFCDILRSYIIQYGLWSLNGLMCYGGPSTVQERNEHDLFLDLEDEIQVYTNIEKLVKLLDEIYPTLEGKPELDLLTIYLKLAENQIVKPEEIEKVKVWIQTCQTEN